jgi:hypothetical protein
MAWRLAKVFQAGRCVQPKQPPTRNRDQIRRKPLSRITSFEDRPSLVVPPALDHPAQM